MKKLVMCVVTGMMLLSLVGCSESKASNDETESSTENEVAYPTKDPSESPLTQPGAYVEETAPAREKWIPEEETTPNEEIAVNELEETYGDEIFLIKLKLSEYVYAGDSGLSRYEFSYSVEDAYSLNGSFEGPAGISAKAEFFENGSFKISDAEDEEWINIIPSNFIFSGFATKDEFAEISSQVKEMYGEMTQKDWLEVFDIMMADYITVTGESVEYFIEYYDASIAGYSALKWYYDDPVFMSYDYGCKIGKGNDDNSSYIFDTMKWSSETYIDWEK